MSRSYFARIFSGTMILALSLSAVLLSTMNVAAQVTEQFTVRDGEGKTRAAWTAAPQYLVNLDAVGPETVGPDPVNPVPREEEWWVKRQETINARAERGDVDLIFLGDSITQGWEGNGKEVWKKQYGHRRAMNAGIGGDRTQHVLWRMENGNLENISPKLAVVMIGTNNSGADTSREIAAGVEAIVGELRAKLPKTKVLLLAIFPREDPRRQTNEKANDLFKRVADGDMVHYLDIGDKFLDKDGILGTETMPDLLHLTPAAYQIWADSIEAKVVELMGEEK